MGLARGQFWTPRPAHRAWGKLAPVKLASTEGADWTFKAAPGYFSRVLVARATLTTANAEAGNRIPGLKFTDGNNTVFEQFYVGNVAEKLTRAISWLTGQPFAEQVQANNAPACSLADIPLLPGWTLGSTTVELKAKDTWTGVLLYVEQWPLDGPDIVAEHEALYRRVAHLERMIEHDETVHA